MAQTSSKKTGDRVFGRRNLPFLRIEQGGRCILNQNSAGY